MTDHFVTTPAPFVPLEALAFGDVGDAATPVSTDNPLPVLPVSLPASSAVLAGSTPTATVAGPFVPERSRPIVLTLSGVWTGSARLLRSVDGGATSQPLTLAGGDWGLFTGNCNEPVWIESEADAIFYLALTPLSGTIAYRVSQ